MTSVKDKDTNLKSLFGDLHACCQSSEYEGALKIANKILKLAPTEVKAFHCKIVCMIHLSKFEEALQAINKSKLLDLTFEKAYCQYRTKQINEALKTLEGDKSGDVRNKELRAQILYRSERYNECADIYKSIIKNSIDDYEDEREANYAAVISSLIRKDKDFELPALRQHTYELCYNAACSLLNRGLITEAHEKLKEAAKLCRASLEEEGLAEQEIEEELAIIKVQMAFCLQIQGQEKEAHSIYNSVLQLKPSDLGLVAVASNNATCINRDQNIFDSKKKMRAATSSAVEEKLTKFHCQTILYNQTLLSLCSNQTDLCLQQLANLRRQFPDILVDSVLVEAALLVSLKRESEAADLLQKQCASCSVADPSSALKLKLALVHVLLKQGNILEAAKSLSAIDAARPGIIGTVTSLYLSQGRTEEALSYMDAALRRLQKNDGSKEVQSALLKQASQLCLANGKMEEATRYLESICSINPNDTKSLAQLISAYAQFDAGKAERLSKDLPPVDELIGSVDVDSLESSSCVLGVKMLKRSAKEPLANATEEVKKKPNMERKKKKKKKRLPKNYDPNKAPDPERWLPLRERSTFRRRGGKGGKRKEVSKGPQGAAGSTDQFDITKMAPTQKPVVVNNQMDAKQNYTGTDDVKGPPRQQVKRGGQQKKRRN